MNDQVLKLLVDRIDKSEETMCMQIDGVRQEVSELKDMVQEINKQRWKAAGRSAAYGSIGAVITFVIGLILQVFKTNQ